MFGYFRLASFLFLVCFTYLSLRLMVSNVKMAALPALMIVYGVISMGGSTTDFNAVANDYLYYFAFGMAGVITILFFPTLALRYLIAPSCVFLSLMSLMSETAATKIVTLRF